MFRVFNFDFCFTPENKLGLEEIFEMLYERTQWKPCNNWGKKNNNDIIIIIYCN